MVTPMPEPKGLPQDCPDSDDAAIWLPGLRDAETKLEAQTLTGTLKEASAGSP